MRGEFERVAVAAALAGMVLGPMGCKPAGSGGGVVSSPDTVSAPPAPAGAPGAGGGR